MAIQADGKIVTAGRSGRQLRARPSQRRWLARPLVLGRWPGDDRLRRLGRRRGRGDPGRRQDRGRGSLRRGLRARPVRRRWRRSTRRSAAMAGRPPTSEVPTAPWRWRSEPTGGSWSPGVPATTSRSPATGDGALDTTFSGDGRLTTDFGGFDSGKDLAIQRDGRIVVAGASDTSGDPGPASDFALARYLADGALDTTFSADGRQTTDFDGSYDIGEASRSRRTAGSSSRATVPGPTPSAPTTRATSSSPAIDAGGALDTSFSDDGRLTTDFGGDEFGYGVAVQPNGRIVAIGKTAGAFALARYTAEGALDTGFSGDGKQTTDGDPGGLERARGRRRRRGRRQDRRGRGPPPGRRHHRLRARPLSRRRARSGHAGHLARRGPIRADERDGAVVHVHVDDRGLDVRVQARHAVRRGQLRACSSPRAYTTTANGNYTFSVRASAPGEHGPDAGDALVQGRHGRPGDVARHGPGRLDDRRHADVHVLVQRAGLRSSAGWTRSSTPKCASPDAVHLAALRRDRRGRNRPRT